MNNTDLISRNALLGGYDVRKVTEYDESGCGLEYKAVSVEAIEAAPAVDAEPVRHGRWIYDINNLYGCSECMTRESMSHRNMKNYCPNCGAKMDAEVRDMRDATLCGCNVCKHYYRPDANVRIYACRKFGEFGKFDYIKDDGSMFCGAFEWRGVEVEHGTD